MYTPYKSGTGFNPNTAKLAYYISIQYIYATRLHEKALEV